MNYMAAYELCKMVMDYTPLVISLNYNHGGTQYAMISYGVFTKNSTGDINGARIEKQVVIVSKHCASPLQINGMPFEIKSIYGLDSAEA